MNRLVQRGYNSKYPLEIDTWRLGEVVPEWLSDISKVKVSESGAIELDVNSYNDKGGFEIHSSSGVGIVCRTSNKEDYVCRGRNIEQVMTIFPLTVEQLDILYKEVIE